MILNDTFSGADGSLLTDHTADSGATYVMNPNADGDVRINGGRAHSNGTALACSSAAAGDCEITGVFRCLSADGQYAGLLGRASTTAVDWYSVLLQFGGGVALGGNSTLGTFPMTFEAGLDYRAKLEMRGTLIRAFVNGFEFKRVINSERSTGRIGFCCGGSTSETTGLHLDSLEGRNESATSQVLFHGDSLTSGQGTSEELAHADKYPTQTMGLLGGSFDWANLGVSGRTLVDLLANAAEIDDCRRAEAENDVVVLWAGVNDLAGLGASPSTVIDRLTEYAAGRRALGFRVLALTIIAADEAHPAIPAGFNSQREIVNTWLRANWADHFDGLADVAADSRLSDPADATYYQADGIHLVAGGATVVAEIVAGALSSMGLACFEITSPVDGEIVLAGAATEIAWETAGVVPAVRIEFSVDSGATYADVLEDELANSGSYSWTPTGLQVTATGRIRVVSAEDAVEAESSVFKVATTSPSGGGGVTAEQLASALEELREHGDDNWGRNPILPVTARVNQEPVAKTTLTAYQRGRSLHRLVVVDSTGAGVDLSGKSLQFTLETLSGARVGTTSDVSVLGADENVASFTAEEEWHLQPGLFRYALRDVGEGARVWARGDYLIEPTAGPV